MIPHHGIIASKVVLKGAVAAVILTAATIGAYEITPETFSTVAVGVGALVIALASVITMIINASNNTKNREQMAQIAKDQAVAITLTNASNQHLQTLEVRMDGRMDKLLAQSGIISEAIGIKKGLQQAADTAEAKADSTAARDDKIVDKVADAVATRIGEAADKAALTVPGSDTSAKQ